MQVFFDFEFTGLHQKTTPISLGMYASNGLAFYAEFSDYDESQLNDWLRGNVIANLQFPEKIKENIVSEDCGATYAVGSREFIAEEVRKWFGHIAGVNEKGICEMWGDVLGYDWVLFCELFGGAFSIPQQCYYIPFDISTLMKMKGVDPDINREEYAEVQKMGGKHNALWDAEVIKSCYRKLTDHPQYA